MKRWLWNVFCALSLLIFATSMTMWVRSYSVGESLHWLDWELDWTPQRKLVHIWSYRLACSRGDVSAEKEYRVTTHNWSGHAGWSVEHWVSPFPVYPWRWSSNPTITRFLGTRFSRTAYADREGSLRSTFVAVPLWLFLIFAVPPLVWWRIRRKLGGPGFPLQPIPKTESPQS